MALGLIVLGALALLMFFGVTNRLFERIGISNWVAFFLALALGLSVLIPDITFGRQYFAMSVSAFLLPLIIVGILLAKAATTRRFMISLSSILIVASATTVIRLAVPPTTNVMAISSGIVTGLVAGILAYAVGRNHLATITGAIGGIILGDVIGGGLHNLMTGQSLYVLGGLGVFDAIVIGAVFSLIFVEVIGAIRRNAYGERHVRRAVTAEAGKDVTHGTNRVEHTTADKYLKDGKCGCNVDSEVTRPKYRDYFEDEM
ncbi:MAG: DUF1614 domain-containing protein [Firmicutes bacterium]|nr:DUF1614 domain-containing protein [Bacillota bacterium]